MIQLKAVVTVLIAFAIFNFFLLNRRQDPECPCDRERLDKDKVLNACTFSQNTHISLHPSETLNLAPYF